MSTLTKYSAMPYTGPAPTNRNPYVPPDAPKTDARGAELAGLLRIEQERGQDLPTLIVEKERIVEVLRALQSEHRFNLPLDLWGVDYPRRDKRFDVMYQLYSLDNNERVRLKVRLGEDELVESATSVYKG
ncbi:MAG TPA: NADH-quinone oxidoreductase subunit C, partial [Thermoanaerobaculia bacterium]